jgi:hypothetical protein
MPYLLPDEIDPPRISVCVPVPDDAGHRRAFLDAIYQLSWSNNWERDAAHTAADVSRVWAEIYDLVSARVEAEEDCSVPSIIDMRNENCTLEVRYDDDPETWVAIGQFFPLDASCHIENTTYIDNPGNSNQDHLVLRNEGNAPSSDTASLLWSLQLNSGVETLASRVRGGWTDPTGARGKLEFLTYENGVDNYNLRLNAGAIAALVDMWSGRGQTTALRLASNNQGFSESLTLFETLAQGRQMLIMRLSGRNLWQRGTTLTNGVSDFNVYAQFASSGTPAAGFGQRQRFRLQSSTTENREAAAIDVVWAVATDASRSGELQLKTSDYAGERTNLRLSALNGVSQIGFHNTAPITKRIHTAVTEFDAIEEINATLHAYGLISDATVVVADEPGEGEPGPQGEQGPQGEPGPQGEQGPAGDCIDCGQPSETPGEDTYDKKCNIASYLVDLVLPDLVDQVLDEQELAGSIAALLSVVLGIVATIVAGPAGLAIGSGIAGFIATLFGLDNATIRAELDAQYWEDVRCRLLGSVPLDGILTPAALEDMALSVENIADKPNMNQFLPALLRNFTGAFAGQVSVLGALYDGDCSLCPVDECGFTGLFDDAGIHEDVTFSMVKLSDFSVRVTFEYQNLAPPDNPTWYQTQFVYLFIEEGCETVDSLEIVYERPPSGYNRVDPPVGECDAGDPDQARRYVISFAGINQPPVSEDIGQDEITSTWEAASPSESGLRIGWTGCRFVSNTATHRAETIIRITEINGAPTGA